MGLTPRWESPKFTLQNQIRLFANGSLGPKALSVELELYIEGIRQ